MIVKPTKYILLLIISLITYIFFNFITLNLFNKYKFDVTDNKKFTLSYGTIKILENIPKKIILRFYFSKDIAKKNPILLDYFHQIKELLYQYKLYAKEKIFIQIIDVNPNNNFEYQAINHGLHSIPIDKEGNELFLGLVGTNAFYKKSIIKFFQINNEYSLEYDITKLIYSLVNKNKKKIYLLSEFEIKKKKKIKNSNLINNTWLIWKQLQSIYDIKIINHNINNLNCEISLLILINPFFINYEFIYKIDKYLTKGGNLLLFVDPFTEVIKNQSKKINSYTILKPLFKAWGIKFLNKKIVLDISLSKEVKYRSCGKDYFSLYPLWLNFQKSSLNKSDIVTYQMNKISLSTPGVIKNTKNSSLKVSKLIKTTNQSMLIKTHEVYLYQKNIPKMLRNYISDNKSYTIAVRINGLFKSIFFETHPLKKSNIIIIADSDLLHEAFWINIKSFIGYNITIPISDNSKFIIGIIDHLSGNNNLINIRNRSKFIRTFIKFDEIKTIAYINFQKKEKILIKYLDSVRLKLKNVEKNNLLNKNNINIHFRKEIIKTRNKLRIIQYRLNQQINDLKIYIQFFNIFFIPITIIFIYILNFFIIKKTMI